jgi:hypothetical protein
MGRAAYLRQLKGNHIEMNIDMLPDCAFIDAIKVVDICSFKILGKKSKDELGVQRGAPDIQLESMEGNKSMITRQELCENFVHSSGRPIKLHYLSSDTRYIVYRKCNQAYKIIKLPCNCRGLFHGTLVKPNSYIVGRAEQDGSIIKSSLAVVSQTMFKKAFSIPMQNVIKRNMDGEHNKEFNASWVSTPKKSRGSTRRQPLNQNKTVRNIFENTAEAPRININLSKAPPTQMSMGAFGNRMSNQGQSKAVVSEKAETGYRFTAIARLVNANSKKVVGFMIQDNKTGKKKQVALDQVKQMCKAKAVSNLMLVIKEGTDITFLRGNGVVISNLPELIV